VLILKEKIERKMTQQEKDFIITHISELHNGIKNFLRINSNLNEQEVKTYLSQRFSEYLENPNNHQILYTRLQNTNFTKARIIEIANDLGFYKPDLEKFYRQYLLKKGYEENIRNLPDLTSNVLENIKQNMNEREFNFIKVDYEKIVEKTMYMTLKGGFSENLTNINMGVMVANAGDAAEFLFVARAILNGYNCSSVDVRSSRYDAIIDFKGKLLRIQIKGISSNQVSFKDRDRGGQGIDHTHERNRGQRITSEDCDIYVAVDKQIGIIYLIPMYEVDLFEDNELTKKTEDLTEYKENWEIIYNVVERLSTQI